MPEVPGIFFMRVPTNSFESRRIHSTPVLKLFKLVVETRGHINQQGDRGRNAFDMIRNRTTDKLIIIMDTLFDTISTTHTINTGLSRGPESEVSEGRAKW